MNRAVASDVERFLTKYHQQFRDASPEMAKVAGLLHDHSVRILDSPEPVKRLGVFPAPTGSGKSTALKALMPHLLQQYPDKSFLVAAPNINEVQEYVASFVESAPPELKGAIAGWVSEESIVGPDGAPFARADIRKHRLAVVTQQLWWRYCDRSDLDEHLGYLGDPRSLTVVDESLDLVRVGEWKPGEVYRLIDYCTEELGTEVYQPWVEKFAKLVERYLSLRKGQEKFWLTKGLETEDQNALLNLADFPAEKVASRLYLETGQETEWMVALVDAVREITAGRCFGFNKAGGPVLITYRSLKVPPNHLCLDATAPFDGTTTLNPDCQLLLAPETKWDKVTLNYFDPAPEFRGKKQLRRSDNRQEFSRLMTPIVSDLRFPGADALVVTDKEFRVGNGLLDTLANEDLPELMQTHWFGERGSNSFRSAGQVFLFGAPFLPSYVVYARYLGLRGELPTLTSLKQLQSNHLDGDLHEIRLDLVVKEFIQSANRGASRQCLPGGYQAPAEWFASCGMEIALRVQQALPGLKVKPWEVADALSGTPSLLDQLRHQIDIRMQNMPSGVILFSELRSATGRQRNQEIGQSLRGKAARSFLEDRGIRQEMINGQNALVWGCSEAVA